MYSAKSYQLTKDYSRRKNKGEQNDYTKKAPVHIVLQNIPSHHCFTEAVGSRSYIFDKRKTRSLKRFRA